MIHEDYLKCSDYEHQTAHATEAGFAAFFYEADERHFFALHDADGKVILKSEGYPQPAARENGIQSVIKNRENKDFYSVKQENGRYYLSLRAANYREIARSCSCDTEAEALAILPFATGEQIRTAVVTAPPVVEPIAIPIAAAIATPIAAVATVVAAETAAATAAERQDDDYLACREYEGHADAGIDGFANFAKFTHSNEQHYFVCYDDRGKVIFRSEGYTTTSARDNGMASVNKNRELEERYSTMEKLGRYFVILKAGNHQEIARSCPYESEAAAMATFPGARVAAAAVASPNVEAPIAAIAAVAAAAFIPEAVAPVVPPASADVEDDYLPCKEYETQTINDKVNNVSMFKHSNGQYYFAIFNSNGSVRIRSEGFRAAQDRDKELSGALKSLNNPDMYSVIKRGEYYISVLKDKTGKEVGRSCMQKEEPKAVVAPVAPPVAAPIAAVAAVAAAAAFIPKEEATVKITPPIPPPVYATAAPVVEEAASGFNWWWLLIPALLLLAVLLYKSCSKEAPVAAAPAAAVQVPVPAPAAVPAAPVPVAAPASCDLNWILFDFNKSNISDVAKKELEDMAKILKEHKDYVGVLKAHTDAKGGDAYNDALSGRRATEAKSYLTSLGIETGRIKTTASGKGDPFAKNTEDDAGRKFNRRVELSIQDKDGKNVCQSIPPTVSSDLKAK